MFNFKKLALSLGVFSLALGTTTLLNNAPHEETVFAATTNTTHTVIKGDTLWSISKKYNVSVSVLKSYNNLKSDVIQKGQKLIVKKATTSTASNVATATHKVVKGDTLTKIANKYNTTITSVKNLNNLSSNTIYIGQILKVSGTTTTTATSNTATSNNSSTSTNKVIAGYSKTYRSYGTNIHVYVSDSDDKLDISYGVKGKLEPLSNISLPNEKAKANLGFFASSYEHAGLFYKDSTIYSGTVQRHLVVVINKSNKMLIKDFGASIDSDEKTWLHNNAKIAFGTSYSLVNSGAVNLYNSSQFSHATAKNPRTMLGQLPDGRFVLAVTDGRVSGSSGLTASESANFMKSLGVSNAVNLDGGGSSTLIHGGKIRNALSGGQRSIGSAIFITD